MVVKAQRSLDGKTALIYNKDRSVQVEIPFEGAIATALGDRDKVYLKARIDTDGILHLHSEVHNQNW